MKRLIGILLALTMLFSLAACGAEEKENVEILQNSSAETVPVIATEAAVSEEKAVQYNPQDLDEVGYWDMIRIDSDDPNLAVTEEEVAEVKGQGIPMYIELLEDGTGVLCFEDETEFTWADGKFSAEGESCPLYLQENRLILDMEEMDFVYRRAEKPGSRTSELEQAGFTEYMQEWESYPYTTICGDDESKTTTGEATVIAYEVFTSADGYPEKEGYEWRVATIEVRFFDENAQKYGSYAFARHEDYYEAKLHDETEKETNESEDYFSSVMTRVYLGRKIETYFRFRDSWSSWRKNSKGELEVFYNAEFAFQVPEGYDGVVAGLVNGSYEQPEGAYITDCEPEYFLLFRLK